MYTLGEFHKNRNNGTVFEELEVSIEDLTVVNSTVIPILMKFSPRVHTGLKIYK